MCPKCFFRVLKSKLKEKAGAMHIQAVWVKAESCLSLTHHCFGSTCLQGSLTSSKSLPGDFPQALGSLFSGPEIPGEFQFLRSLCMSSQQLQQVQQMEALVLILQRIRNENNKNSESTSPHSHKAFCPTVLLPFNASLQGCWHSLCLMNDRTGQG